MEKIYPIAYYDVDLNMVLKPSALLNFLQDAATINAEMHGFGYSFTHPKNYGWFLIKYKMEFDEYPQNLDDILIKTDPRGVSKIIANRDFEIWTSDNKKRLGRVVSNWMMIDLNTKNDVNQHVNNANYIIWAFETLPFEFKSKHKLKSLDIVYKKEIQFGHKIISQTQIDETTSTHVVKNATTGEDLCLIKALWI